MTDGHYGHYQEMLDKVDWNKYGVVDGVARDPRCENCMVHCGYDPSGALGTNYKPGDNWKNFKYNFSPRPVAFKDGAKVNAFNGVSAGRGHLAEAKAAVKSGLAGARSAFQANGGHDHNLSEGNAAGGCSTGDTSQRDELLTKIRGPKES
jgi:hypothetical protein